jgi:hypothetical protein
MVWEKAFVIFFGFLVAIMVWFSFLSYENHEGKDLAVMFLLVLVLLLLFSFIEIGFWSLGKIVVVGPVGTAFSERDSWLCMGLRPRPLEGLGDLPTFWRVGYRRPILPRTQSAKINAPQNNYKPENALNASRIVFVPSLIPEGVLVHSNAMAGRSHAFRRCSCFPSAPESGGGQLGEGKSNY